jgi:hypothetical protein
MSSLRACPVAGAQCRQGAGPNCDNTKLRLNSSMITHPAPPSLAVRAAGRGFAAKEPNLTHAGRSAGWSCAPKIVHKKRGRI